MILVHICVKDGLFKTELRKENMIQQDVAVMNLELDRLKKELLEFEFEEEKIEQNDNDGGL